MRLKRKGELILNADIVTPETVIGVFSDNITSQAKSEMVATYNSGADMLNVYESYRGDMHITNVVRLLYDLEEVYRVWSQEKFTIQRRYAIPGD